MARSPKIHREFTSTASIDAIMVAATRFVLAISALLIILIDPTEPDRLVYETYTVLILYTFYSLYIFLTLQFGLGLPLVIQNHSWWIDSGSYLILVSLSSGTNSIFFFFFFFAVLTAAFARGFRTGFAVVLVSALGFWIVALFTTPAGPDFDLGRYLLRPMSLLILGYMMSTWGGLENRSLRRLELLRQIGIVSNPRFGINRTISLNIELLRSFYRADRCVCVLYNTESHAYDVYHTAGPHSSEFPNSIKAESSFAAKLLSMPDNIAAIYASRYRLTSMRETAHTFDCEGRNFVTAEPGPLKSLCEMLEANSLITVPIYYRHRSIGRFFGVSSTRDKFDKSDITFLLQAVDHFIPIVENIRLVDQMASDAAEQERKKIARDLHDSIIQPYIGLQIGIESVAQIIDGHNGEKANISKLSSRVENLKRIAEQGIEDLRDYVHGLTDGDVKRATFNDSMQRFACKFTSGTGIDVEINYDPELSVGDRLAAEVFQIFAESLSNVRKHTQSTKAVVNLSSVDDQLVMEIHDQSEGVCAKDFSPRSITQRAESLGGSTNVVCNKGSTMVKVHIPM